MVLRVRVKSQEISSCGEINTRNELFFLNNTMIYYSNEQYMVEIHKLSSAIIK
jgi:hypothetical protein